MNDEFDLNYWQKDKRFSADLFYLLAEQAPFSIQIFSMDGDAIYVNEGWKEFWSAASRERGVKDYNVLKDKQIIEQGLIAGVRRAFKGDYVEFPVLFYDPSKIGEIGKARWLSPYMFPIKDLKKEQQIGAALFHFDVTAQKQLEAKIEEKTKELALKVSELERLNKLMVGREFKMAELKKEIGRLKNKLND